MRKTIIAGNWKMNKTKSESIAFAKDLKNKIDKIEKTDVIVCPGFVSLCSVSEILKETRANVGAQNMHWEPSGAYTGEVSAEMIESCGCQYVLVGHSERRQYFDETDDKVNNKIKRALTTCCISPILCVGETLEQREAGKTNKVIEKQIKQGLEGLSHAQMQRIIVAYEPVWAIGTGVTATPEQAQEVHGFIRKTITMIFDEQIAEKLSILYGGSVKPSNISELLHQKDIDGGLIGGASLKLDSFVEMIEIAEQLSN
ncbi:triose-phosphate isomerase [candidate division KSB1 bacterium 4572_119]|nr:MAG: triose-phosphate isomerase [candidate division KSB1 bacterium 4572_119]